MLLHKELLTLNILSGVCPTGLKGGFIRWDDEQSSIDMNNANYGSLPDGI